MALSSTASIVFMNYSLRLNSVGFYQLSKLLGVPWLIFVQHVFYRKSIITTKITLSLCLILIGLGIATVSDVQLNLAGAITSALGVMITTQYQIWQGEKQSEFNLNALQISYAQALPTFIICALFAVFIDGQNKQFYEHVWTREEILLVFLGCLLALVFNISTYGILGLTSPLTFATNIIGLILTMLGVGLYTLWSIKKRQIHSLEEENAEGIQRSPEPTKSTDYA
ncbi:unnamed protein product [Rotaria sp. Silwood2]|nr:unnamed protein product [Rotaria sp. Silwood2]